MPGKKKGFKENFDILVQNLCENWYDDNDKNSDSRSHHHNNKSTRTIDVSVSRLYSASAAYARGS
jgi:hypothetical protein